MRRCLSCYQPFEPNDALEHLPNGRRIAYDPARGRLWVICASCARWSLAPLETRWETLEQLERLSSGSARLLKQGENIALFESGTLELVRVGRANAREEAWWRYGSEFGARRRHARALVARGKVIDALIMLAVSGIPFWGHSDPGHWIKRGRVKAFGRNAWRGDSSCSRCGHQLRHIHFTECAYLQLEPQGQSFGLWYWCPRCGATDRAAGHHLAGLTAEHVLRRVLAYQNFAGGSEYLVDRALALVDRYESPELLIRQAAAEGTPLGHIDGPRSLAAEIALNSALEAQLLDDEVAVLELRWREEEALAAIIDGELSPLPSPGR